MKISFIKNFDVYIIKRLIFNSVKSNLNQFKGECLDVGCGSMPYKELLLQSSISNYTSLDIPNSEYQNKGIVPDFFWDGNRMPFDDEKFESIICTEVLEHTINAKNILEEMYRVLKPDGFLFFTVPFFWPLHCVPDDYFRYTPFSLSKIIKDAGFKELQIKANGGWHSSLGQILALWVTNGISNTFLRKIIKLLLIPIVYLLYKIDSPANDFNDRMMMVGLYGIIKK